MMLRRTAVVALAAGLLLLAGASCARSESPRTSRAYAADDLVIRVKHVGGLVPVSYLISELPEVSVYGDGRVVTPGPVDAIYPGPAMPPVLVQHISVDDVRRLVDRGIDAGVGNGMDLGQPPVMDAPATYFEILTDTGRRTSHAEALGIGGGTGLSGAQQSARQRLVDYRAALTNLAATLGSGAVDPPSPYVGTAVAAAASEYTADPQLPAPPEQAWPGPELPGAPVTGALLSCVTATGSQAQDVYTAATKANAITPWVSAGSRWRLALRPLLPDESSCADLQP